MLEMNNKSVWRVVFNLQNRISVEESVDNQRCEFLQSGSLPVSFVCAMLPRRAVTDLRLPEAAGGRAEPAPPAGGCADHNVDGYHVKGAAARPCCRCHAGCDGSPPHYAHCRCAWGPGGGVARWVPRGGSPVFGAASWDRRRLVAPRASSLWAMPVRHRPPPLGCFSSDAPAPDHACVSAAKKDAPTAAELSAIIESKIMDYGGKVELEETDGEPGEMDGEPEETDHMASARRLWRRRRRPHYRLCARPQSDRRCHPLSAADWSPDHSQGPVPWGN